MNKILDSFIGLVQPLGNYEIVGRILGKAKLIKVDGIASKRFFYSYSLDSCFNYIHDNAKFESKGWMLTLPDGIFTLSRRHIIRQNLIINGSSWRPTYIVGSFVLDLWNERNYYVMKNIIMETRGKYLTMNGNNRKITMKLDNSTFRNCHLNISAKTLIVTNGEFIDSKVKLNGITKMNDTILTNSRFYVSEDSKLKLFKGIVRPSTVYNMSMESTPTFYLYGGNLLYITLSQMYYVDYKKSYCVVDETKENITEFYKNITLGDKIVYGDTGDVDAPNQNLSLNIGSDWKIIQNESTNHLQFVYKNDKTYQMYADNYSFSFGSRWGLNVDNDDNLNFSKYMENITKFSGFGIETLNMMASKNVLGQELIAQN